MTGQQRKYKRRHYFVKKEFQSKFTLWLLMVSSIGNILAVLLFIMLADRKVDSLLYSMKIPSTVFKGKILLGEAIYANALAAGVIVIIFIIAGRYIFRKIAGPLDSIRVELQRMARGNLLSEIVRRRNDEFKDFAGDINNLGRELKTRLSAISSRAERVAEIADELQKTPSLDRERLNALMQETKELQKKIKAFKI